MKKAAGKTSKTSKKLKDVKVSAKKATKVKGGGLLLPAPQVVRESASRGK